MRDYRQFINESDSKQEIEDEGINKEEKKDLKEKSDEKERLENIEQHDKEVEISESKVGHVQKKIKFDIDIESSQHAVDRLNRKKPNGEDAYEPITFKEVNSVISKATEEIILELAKDEMDVSKDRFILQRESDGLTVVGIMNVVKDEFQFVVITLFRGGEFRTGRDQKIIKV